MHLVSSKPQTDNPTGKPTGKQTDEEALKSWEKYLAEKAPMLVRPTPKSYNCYEPFIVVPAVDKRFVMGQFSTEEKAQLWCTQKGLTSEIVGK